MDDEKTPFWAKCKCGHVWTCAYTPMGLTTLGKLLKALHCPSCGRGSKDITPAKQDAGKLLEPAT